MKLVLDVPEMTYQVLAVKAHKNAVGVTEYVMRVLDAEVAASVPLPLLDQPAAEPAAAPAEEVGHGKRRRS